jgi:predicted phosphoribosyltransferase
MICPMTPSDFGAVSRFYQDFHQVSDVEVRELLTASGWPG